MAQSDQSRQVVSHRAFSLVKHLDDLFRRLCRGSVYHSRSPDVDGKLAAASNLIRTRSPTNHNRLQPTSTTSATRRADLRFANSKGLCQKRPRHWLPQSTEPKMITIGENKHSHFVSREDHPGGTGKLAYAAVKPDASADSSSPGCDTLVEMLGAMAVNHVAARQIMASPCLGASGSPLRSYPRERARRRPRS